MSSPSPYFIILNGPPDSGKTTEIANGLAKRLQQFKEFRTVSDSFANPMKHFIATALGVKYAELKKEVMMGVLNGYTPREFLIDLSENYMKVRYHDDIFGRLLLHRTIRLDPIPDLVIIDDGGFASERDALGHKARVVRVTRPGRSFSGDSRMYLPDPHYNIDNDGSISDLQPKLDELADWCINLLPYERRPNSLGD
jgi:hypothetical protein